MSADIFPSVSSLNEQLQEARDKLRETEENIKRATGRDTIEPVSRVPRHIGNSAAAPLPPLRNAATRTPSFVGVTLSFVHPTDEPQAKRPRAVNSFHPVVAAENGAPTLVRRGGWDDEDEYRRRKVQSTIIVDPTPMKTREERISEASVRVGDKDVARNRRIFGSLMGTLKKFQIEQNTRAQTDERQKEIRKKLEEKEAAEKREAQRERKELFWERKRSQAVVKFLETKMDIVKRFSEWETSQKPLMMFLKSDGTNPVYYVPKSMNSVQQEKLEKTRKLLEAEIQSGKESMEQQLRRLDEKIEYFNASKTRGQDVSLEDHIEETKKKLKEVPLDDIDVDDIDLDDNDVEGLELIAVDVPVDVEIKSVKGENHVRDDTIEMEEGSGEAAMDIEEPETTSEQVPENLDLKNETLVNILTVPS